MAPPGARGGAASPPYSRAADRFLQAAAPLRLPQGSPPRAQALSSAALSWAGAAAAGQQGRAHLRSSLPALSPTAAFPAQQPHQAARRRENVAGGGGGGDDNGSTRRRRPAHMPPQSGNRPAWRLQAASRDGADSDGDDSSLSDESRDVNV